MLSLKSFLHAMHVSYALCLGFKAYGLFTTPYMACCAGAVAEAVGTCAAHQSKALQLLYYLVQQQILLARGTPSIECGDI
jgi:hypothetical protein